MWGQKTASNLTQKEWTDLQWLQHQQHLLVLKVDKGDMVVLMDYQSYKHHVYKPLHDPSAYAHPSEGHPY